MLTFLILAGCGQSNSEEKTMSISDTLPALDYDTILKDTIISDQQKSTEENQNKEDYRK